MTIRRDDEILLLEDVCAIEDAEILMQELQAGATRVDWSGCTHLHTACLQVILAARVPIFGTPANPTLARWLAPILPTDATPVPHPAEPETACRMEA